MDLHRYNMGESVMAFSTKRNGGVSSGAYATFNITDYCGDDERCVLQNRKLLCNALGITDDALFLPRQTHGDKVFCADEDFLSQPAHLQREQLYGVDAIVTAMPRVCVGVSTADCVPVLVYDKRKRIVAAIHAGWRGTVARVAEKALATMSQRYATQPSDVCAVIGPSISLNAFEVGDEVYDAFAIAGFPMEQIACRISDKWHIDLWECNRLQLLGNGVLSQNISVSGICTYSRHNEFFSARRLGINSGRIFNGIMIK